MRRLRGLLLDAFFGLWTYRYPPCCVLAYVWTVARGGEPARAWYLRNGVPIEDLDEIAIWVGARNTVWGEESGRPWIPCRRCEARAPGTWLPLEGDA